MSKIKLANIKGPKGDKGDKGDPGTNGSGEGSAGISLRNRGWNVSVNGNLN